MNILDVRTPPKVQSQIKDKLSSKYSIETSHAGVAIPVDEDVLLEESTKRANFYKLDRPTTASGGLSTWILLSGHSSSTTPSSPSTKKPITMTVEKSNETLLLTEKPVKLSKPVFKQRSTTLKPATTTSKKTTTVRVNTFSPSAKTTTRKPAKLTKVKASLLQSLTNATTTKKPAKHVSTTVPSATQRAVTARTTTQSSASLPLEAKEDDSTLPSTEASKKKTQKKKKNKTRKRKPSKSSKEGNNKLKEVDSPGTQLYSYLRSEIIPVTVGVSLVGLLVTAGLASYYLQPFAALRRSDPIDRKDTAGSYYYQDDYTNAMPEEEAIGKVIAGMPDNVLQDNTATYKQPTSRNAYQQNVRYRQVDRRSQIFMNPYGSVEDVKLHDRPAVNYSEDKKIVVGSPQTEAIPEVTPALVPEHGPRNLKDADRKFVVGSIPEEFYSSGAAPRSMQRKRREALPNDLDNEVFSAENEIDGGDRWRQSTTDKIPVTTLAASEEPTATEESPKSSTPHNVFSPTERPNTFLELISDLFKLKVRLGMELIQNFTSSVSTYVSKVHNRLDEHYRKATRENNHSKTHPN